MIVLVVFLCGCTQPSSDINQTTIQTPSVAISTNANSAYWIKIDPIKEIHLGEVFTITGTTNLPKNDNISFEIYSTSIHCGKNWCTPSYGISGTVSVDEGNNGINRISFNVNSSVLISDEFTVMLSAENRTAYSTELMDVLPPRNATVAPVAERKLDSFHNSIIYISKNYPTSWNFGEGYISTESHAMRGFPREVTYQVSLTITNSMGSDSTLQEIQWPLLRSPFN